MKLNNKLTMLTVAAIIGASMVSSNVAFALTAEQTANQQIRLQNIISKGDQEINRRLASLDNQTAKIDAASRLTASDKATLSSEVATEISGLTALKAKLDAETTLAEARADAQQIFGEYRVYALVLPKVHFVRFADDIQVVDTKFTALAAKLQTRITTEQQAGKDVTSLQAQLTDMNSKISAAQAIASQIEGSVINLQPSDFNSNHQVLSGDLAQLKNARSDNKAALADAQSIISGLKSLR